MTTDGRSTGCEKKGMKQKEGETSYVRRRTAVAAEHAVLQDWDGVEVEGKGQDAGLAVAQEDFHQVGRSPMTRTSSMDLGSGCRRRELAGSRHASS